MTNELLTIPEVAQELRVHESTVKRWIVQGTLDAVALPCVSKRETYRMRQRYRIKRETLKQIIGAK